MFSKNINHHYQSILFILVVGIYLIHSTYGKCFVIMTRPAISALKRTSEGSDYGITRLFDNDAHAAHMCALGLNVRHIFVDMAFISNVDQSEEIVDFIQREVEQTTKFRILATDSLNFPIPSEIPNMLKTRITTFWTKSIKPHIKRNKNILIVAPVKVLKELVKFLEEKPDEEEIGFGYEDFVPFYYTFNQKSSTKIERTTL